MDSSKVLDFFKVITTLPRESGHEEAMTSYLQEFASSHGLECKRDSIGNICIIRPAAPGKEDVPSIALQAHQDMVCEKVAGCKHDFSKDPIDYVIEDGWMIAKETTLGADDGIGIASCLALLEDKTPTGRIECVFTISEETGMDGAMEMQKGFFTSRTLINLDSEDEGQLFIGCAGGLNTIIELPYKTEPRHPGYECLDLSISGGLGGHSGDDINKERANAVQLMARFLYSELKQGLQLVLISGGGKHNAIPREAHAIVSVPVISETVKRFTKFGEDVNAEYHVTDPSLKFTSSRSGITEKGIDAVSARRLITTLCSCPHGVYAMSQDIPGLVETSTNLAAVRMTQPGIIRILTSQRSSIESEKRMMADKVEANFALIGAKIERQSEYPGWKPDVKSPLLARCVESYKRLFHQDPIVLSIHAGLECGLFLQKFPGLDMISFGPTLRGVHTPGEKLELASLDKFVTLLGDLVCNYK